MTTATSIRLPHLATRKEVAEYCNQGAARTEPITARIVERWETEGWLKRHAASKSPIRYTADAVIKFLAGQY